MVETKNRIDFLISWTNLGAKLIYEPNREMTQNVRTKSAFKTYLFALSYVFAHSGRDHPTVTVHLFRKK